MSITAAQQCLRLALDSRTPAERLGHLHAAQDNIKKATKEALAKTVEQDGGQDELPLAEGPQGPEVTVDGAGVVRTPADEQAAIDAEDEAARERIRAMDSALPSESELAAVDEAEREWQPA